MDFPCGSHIRRGAGRLPNAARKRHGMPAKSAGRRRTGQNRRGAGLLSRRRHRRLPDLLAPVVARRASRHRGHRIWRCKATPHVQVGIYPHDHGCRKAQGACRESHTIKDPHLHCGILMHILTHPLFDKQIGRLNTGMAQRASAAARTLEGSRPSIAGVRKNIPYVVPGCPKCVTHAYQINRSYRICTALAKTDDVFYMPCVACACTPRTHLRGKASGSSCRQHGAYELHLMSALAESIYSGGGAPVKCLAQGT